MNGVDVPSNPNRIEKLVSILCVLKYLSVPRHVVPSKNARAKRSIGNCQVSSSEIRIAILTSLPGKKEKKSPRRE